MLRLVGVKESGYGYEGGVEGAWSFQKPQARCELSGGCPFGPGRES